MVEMQQLTLFPVQDIYPLIVSHLCLMYSIIYATDATTKLLSIIMSAVGTAK